MIPSTGSPPTKDNDRVQAVGVGKTNCIRQPDHSAGPANEPVELAIQFRRRLGRAIWRASYAAEESRQQYAARGQKLRQAGTSIVLWILRLLRRV